MSDTSRDDGADAPAAPWTPATDANSETAARDKKSGARTKAAGTRAPAGEATLRRRPAAAVPAAAKPEAETAPAAAETAATPEGERIAKAIARAGIASRRDAEAMIAQGRVGLNGQVLDSPAVNVTEADRITVDGEPLPARERTRLWVFHKPRGLVTTARDPEGRPTVFEALPEDLPRVVAVGRLDINTEGLLLLTNDGGLAKVIAHPDTGWLRRYRVRAHGDTTQAELDRLRKGVTIDGMEYGPVEASLDRVQGDNLWLTLGLREGKNREVKRILEHLGLSVNRLIRLSFGPFQLGDLESGLVEEVRTKVLKEQLGKTLSEQAGVDFESPVREPIAPFGSPKDAARKGAGEAGEAEPRAARARSGPARETTRETARPTPRAKDGIGAGPRRSVWRASDETESEAPRPARVPRRGADPKAERAAAAARGRERVGAIRTGERRVLVERLGPSAAEPAAEAAPERRGRYARAEGEARPQRRDARAPREAGEARPPRRDARPARAEGRPESRGGDRSVSRAPRDGAERPRAARPPARAQGENEFRGEPRGDGPRPARAARPGKPAGARMNEDRPGGGFKAGGGRPAGKPGGRGGFGGKPGGGGKPGFGSKPGFGGKPSGRPGGRPPRGGR